MKLSCKQDMAVKACVRLVEFYPKMSSTEQVAELEVFSEAHLGRVFRRLAVAGIVELVRGRKGGVRLAKAPEKVNLAEIIRAIADDAMIEANGGNRGQKRLKGLFDVLQGRLMAGLAQVTLQEVASKDLIRV
jgi:Rrf2 family nitric oxide-sensitive transcriptional repressor